LKWRIGKEQEKVYLNTYVPENKSFGGRERGQQAVLARTFKKHFKKRKLDKNFKVGRQRGNILSTKRGEEKPRVGVLVS